MTGVTIDKRIVSATAADAPFIAWIVAQGQHMDATPDFFVDMCRRKDTLYSWKNTRLLIVDGVLAGGLISYDGGIFAQARARTWVMPDGSRISSGEEDEAEAGQYYLDSLAIKPEFRGHAYWRLLFDDAVGIARSRGFHKAGLIYDEGYPHLGKIYSSYGFRPTRRFMYFGAMATKMVLQIPIIGD